MNFGLLSKDDLKIFLESDPNISLSRRLDTIPFVGKDVPSRASQFSNPDVVIGLSVLAYRYEGLRRSDFVTVITQLREQLDSESGPFHKRPSSLQYASWVEIAGKKVRGPRQGETDGGSTSGKSKVTTTTLEQASGNLDKIWLLHLLDLKDKLHMDTAYKLLRHISHALQYYLNSFVFPLTFEHHLEKISASGLVATKKTPV